MDSRNISELFDEALAGSDLEAVIGRIAALPDDERAALLNALEYFEAEANCQGRGPEVRAILNKFGDGRR